MSMTLAFAQAPGAALAPASPPQLSMLRGAAPCGDVGHAHGWGGALMSAGMALAASAGLVRTAASKRKVGMRASVPFGQPKQIEGPFAGGIVGSEYHGWGEYKWDPLQLSSRYSEHLPWYREAELKHGRVAMLAYVGLVAPDFIRFPGEIFNQDDLDYLSAHKMLITGFGTGPMWWLLFFCGVVESLRFKQLGLGFEKLTLENAGDLDFGKSFMPKSREGMVQMKIKELKNGRLAMLAVSGALTGGAAWQVHHFPFTP